MFFSTDDCDQEGDHRESQTLSSQFVPQTAVGWLVSESTFLENQVFFLDIPILIQTLAIEHGWFLDVKTQPLGDFGTAVRVAILFPLRLRLPVFSNQFVAMLLSTVINMLSV